MRDRLSIRSYSAHATSHLHHYHQVVIPLSGSIEMELGGSAKPLRAGIGDCVVIRAATRHDFRASSAFRFLVADLSQLPDNLAHSEVTDFILDAPALAFAQFVDSQLSSEVDNRIEDKILDLFLDLLARQRLAAPLDNRIQKALQVMRDNLAMPLTINQLARVACLSSTQYKTLFKASMGMTTFQYLTKLRMERARALLSHSDLPIALIAEQVGFVDPSAFSRSFSRYFGQPPKYFNARRG